MTKNKLLVTVFVFLSLFFTLSACGGNSGNDTAPPSQSGGNPPEQSQQGAEGQSADTAQPAVDFPTGPIEILVSAGPGGGSDLMARAIAAELSKVLNTPVNVLNMPSGGGVLVLEEMLNNPADGHILNMENTSSAVLSLVKGERELGKIDGLMLLAEDTYGLHVNAKGKYKTIDDFVAAAKENPGELTIGGQGPLSMDEFTLLLFTEAVGIEVRYIPYDQTGQFQADVLGGHIDAMIDEFPPVMELVDAGEISTLVVFANERLERFPDIPCTVEKGWHVTDGMHRFLTISAGTPVEVIKVLEEALTKVYESESYQQFHKNNMYDLKEVLGGYDETNTLMKRLYDDYSVLFKEMNFANR